MLNSGNALTRLELTIIFLVKVFIPSAFSLLLGKQLNFDVHLGVGDMAQNEVNNPSLFTAMTFCLWVASKSGLIVEYNVTLDKRQHRAFGLFSHRRVELAFMENTKR